jgi:hypothetical protein
MYENLLDDKALIGLIDGFGAVLDTVNEIFETMGGFKTLLPFIAAMFMSKIVPAVMKMGMSLGQSVASFMGLKGMGAEYNIGTQMANDP